MFKNKTDCYLAWVDYMWVENTWTLENLKTSLTACHLDLTALDGNLVKSIQIIHMRRMTNPRFITVLQDVDFF